MKNGFLVSLVFLIQSVFLVANSQYYYYNEKIDYNALMFETGISAGGMNCITDLGGTRGTGKKLIGDINWKNTRPVIGGYLLAIYKNKAGLRIETTYGSVTAYDSVLKKSSASTYGRYDRNLSFKSSILETQLAVEIYPLAFTKQKEHPEISPYVLTGISWYNFEPKTLLEGHWYALQPLKTEGQGFIEYPDRKPYKLHQINLSAGAGLKYEFGDLYVARLELNYRFLFTDYLDDVSTSYIDPALFNNYLPANQASVARRLYFRRNEIDPQDQPVINGQRGNPTRNDSYFSISFKAGLVIGQRRK